MTELTEVRVPDIGDFSDVPVIEVLVEVGDRIRVEDPLVTLESDKATMDVPAPAAGVVRELSVTVGDNVSEGAVLLRIEAQSATTAADAAGDDGAAGTTDHGDRAGGSGVESARRRDAAGDDQAASAGDQDPTTAAGDTATAESTAGATPAPRRDAANGGSTPDRTPTPAIAATETTPTGPAPTDAGSSAAGASAPDPRAPQGRPSPTASLAPDPAPLAVSHATPAMRRYARELGVDLTQVKGTGRKGRILREDISGFVKKALSAPAPATAPGEGGGIPPVPAVDFSRFGEIETRPLSRIKRISGSHLHRSWLNVPHVTNHDEADVTDLEAFRRSIRDEAATAGARITLLAFVTRAVAATLGEFPAFNASLSPDGDAIIVKKYVHIGIAVDTPNGLMVPVLRDAGRKGVYDLAREMAELGARAREGRLKSDELQGGTFTISSLGGIGGTAFTPIINAPEVAILGLSRARMAPAWDGAAFQPRLMLPLDLSWDHRVVDGAEAARFLAHLARLLGDLRRLLL